MPGTEHTHPVARRPALRHRIQIGTRTPANWMQLVKFALVGASGYFVNLAVFGLLTAGAGVHHIPAAITAFCIAVTNNFFWNRHWTFGATAGHAGFQALRFFIVSIGGLVCNLLLLELLISVAEFAELAAQATAVALVMPLNFLGNKLWTFDVYSR